MSPPPHSSPDESNDSSPRWWVVLWEPFTYWLWYRWRASDGDASEGLQADIDRGYEAPSDANVGGVVALSVVLLVLIGVCLIGLVGLYWGFTAEEEAAPSRFADDRSVPPTPRLQPDPAVDLARLHRRTRERLQTYGWVDSAESVVHIPIERAMDLVVERGLPHDSAATADSVRRVLSESGFAWEKRGPPPPSAPAYQGRSPEPFVPDETILRELGMPEAPVSTEKKEPSKQH